MLSFGAIQESIGSLSEWLSSKDNSIMGDDTAFEEENKVEDLLFDDSLDSLQRILTYIKSDSLPQRLQMIREFADCAKEVGLADTKQHLLPLLDNLIKDGEPMVRKSLVEMLPLLFDFVRSEKESNVSEDSVLLLNFAPVLEQAISDQNPDIRDAASTALVALTKDLSQVEKKHFREYFMKLANHPASINRAKAAELLPKCAPNIIETEEGKAAVVSKMSELASDDHLTVRKAVASHLGILSDFLGSSDTTSKLMKILQGLANDEIWGVRKCCLESILQLSTNVKPQTRRQLLSPIFKLFLEDKSRWVKASAIEKLAGFIVTFEDGEVDPELINHFTGLVYPQDEFTKGDADAVLVCAYNFPAVLQTLGRDRWNEVSTIYLTLVRDLQWRVRRTLAHSLHEVARIVGTEITESTLLPAFEQFLKDLDQVKIGVLKHIASFLEVLSPPCRDAYLLVLEDLQKESPWRFRKLLAKQMSKLVCLYDTKSLKQYLLPIYYNLLDDDVHKVRQTAVLQIGDLYKRLCDLSDSEPRTQFIDVLQKYSLRKSCYERQLFPDICMSFYRTVGAKELEEHFLGRFLSLHLDNVPNIRLSVARGLTKLIQDSDFNTESRSEVTRVLEILRVDDDADVGSAALLVG